MRTTAITTTATAATTATATATSAAATTATAATTTAPPSSPIPPSPPPSPPPPPPPTPTTTATTTMTTATALQEQNRHYITMIASIVRASYPSVPHLTVSDLMWHLGVHAGDGGGNNVSHMITRRGLLPPCPLPLCPPLSNLFSSSSFSFSTASATCTSLKHARQWGPYSPTSPAPHIQPPNRALLFAPPLQDLSHTVDTPAPSTPQDAVQPSTNSPPWFWGARSL